MPSLLSTPVPTLCGLADVQTMSGAITPTVSAVAALAMQWAGECLQAVPAPEEARRLVEACAQLTATEPDLKAVLALAPMLDLNAYQRAAEAGVLDVDWLPLRHPEADSARRLDLDLATVAFFASMDDAVSPLSASASDAFSAASGWAVGRASMLQFDGIPETSGLAALVVQVGDAAAALGLHTIDNLVDAVFDVLGCAQQRSARIAVARLAPSWDASVEELVEMAPRLLLDSTANDTDPVLDSWSGHWAQLHPGHEGQSTGISRTTTSDWPKLAFSVLIRSDHATKSDWYNDSVIICRLVLRWGIEYFTAEGASAEATSIYERALVALDLSDDDLGPYLDANPDLLTNQSPSTGIPYTWPGDGLNPPPGLFDAVPADHRAQVWEDWTSALHVTQDLLRERTPHALPDYVPYLDPVPCLDALLAKIVTAGPENIDRYVDEFLTAFGFPEERATRVKAVRAARRWTGTLLSLAAASETLPAPQPAASSWSTCPLDGTFWLTHGNWPAFGPR